MHLLQVLAIRAEREQQSGNPTAATTASIAVVAGGERAATGAVCRIREETRYTYRASRQNVLESALQEVFHND